MPEIAQRIARTLEGVLGMAQQVIDLRHQRLQLLRHLAVQLGAPALLQLGDLLAHPFQRAQRRTHRVTLGQQDQQQRGSAEPQSQPLQAAKALQNGRVVLRHADGKALTKTLVVATIDQQQLATRTVTQAVLQARAGRLGQVTIPQGARAPGLVGEIDTEVVAGKRPLEGRVQAPLVQLHAILAAHQGDQQGLCLVLEVFPQVATQAVIEQPQAALRQDQAHHDQHTGQAQAEATLDRLQVSTPA